MLAPEASFCGGSFGWLDCPLTAVAHSLPDRQDRRHWRHRSILLRVGVQILTRMTPPQATGSASGFSCAWRAVPEGIRGPTIHYSTFDADEKERLRFALRKGLGHALLALWHSKHSMELSLGDFSRINPLCNLSTPTSIVNLEVATLPSWELDLVEVEIAIMISMRALVSIIFSMGIPRDCQPRMVMITPLLASNFKDTNP